MTAVLINRVIMTQLVRHPQLLVFGVLVWLNSYGSRSVIDRDTFEFGNHPDRYAYVFQQVHFSLFLGTLKCASNAQCGTIPLIYVF
jgi:hypothetical protein